MAGHLCGVSKFQRKPGSVVGRPEDLLHDGSLLRISIIVACDSFAATCLGSKYHETGNYVTNTLLLIFRLQFHLETLLRLPCQQHPPLQQLWSILNTLGGLADSTMIAMTKLTLALAFSEFSVLIL